MPKVLAWFHIVCQWSVFFGNQPADSLFDYHSPAECWSSLILLIISFGMILANCLFVYHPPADPSDNLTSPLHSSAGHRTTQLLYQPSKNYIYDDAIVVDCYDNEIDDQVVMPFIEMWKKKKMKRTRLSPAKCFQSLDLLQSRACRLLIVIIMLIVMIMTMITKLSPSRGFQLLDLLQSRVCWLLW